MRDCVRQRLRGRCDVQHHATSRKRIRSHRRSPVEFLLRRCLVRERLCLRRLGSWDTRIVCRRTRHRDFQHLQCRHSDVSASAGHPPPLHPAFSGRMRQPTTAARWKTSKSTTASDISASDVNGSTGRTGVDIVDLSIPFDPIMLSRVDTSDCLVGNPGVCAHGKVHTLSIQRIQCEHAVRATRFMYTSDNDNDGRENHRMSRTHPAPQLVTSLSLTGVGRTVDRLARSRRSKQSAVRCQQRSQATTQRRRICFTSTTFRTLPVPCLLKAFLIRRKHAHRHADRRWQDAHRRRGTNER